LQDRRLPDDLTGRTQARPISNQKPVPDPVSDPNKLKKITEIKPYFDYEPGSDDTCYNLCPIPVGVKCKLPKDKNKPICPDEVGLSTSKYVGRSFDETWFNWEASNLYHNPLYFQDVGLERYGHTHHPLVQPFVSTGIFTTQLFGLPYQMAIDPVCKKMYTLGYYRPGECAPKKHYRVPWNSDAAVVQIGVMTGLIYLFP
jgi:hypothetical protein